MKHKKYINFWRHAVRKNGFRQKTNAKIKYFLHLPICKDARISNNGISVLHPCTVLWFFLLSDPAEFFVAFFQHFMHHYLNTLARQHFTCPRHYYGHFWNWFVAKSVNLNHAYLCYELQSQSATDPHLYASVGMDRNPRGQGTHSFL
jgi:hypothetical protein